MVYGLRFNIFRTGCWRGDGRPAECHTKSWQVRFTLQKYKARKFKRKTDYVWYIGPQLQNQGLRWTTKEQNISFYLYKLVAVFKRKNPRKQRKNIWENPRNNFGKVKSAKQFWKHKILERRQNAINFTWCSNRETVRDILACRQRVVFVTSLGLGILEGRIFQTLWEITFRNRRYSCYPVGPPQHLSVGFSWAGIFSPFVATKFELSCSKLAEVYRYFG